MRVKKNLVVSGLGKTDQVYKYVGTDGCYFRDVSSRNYTILFDRSDDSCSKGAYNGASTKLNNQSARRKLLVNKL
jgi:hypothetical protein